MKSKPPHEIKKTLSLSEARSYIAAISKPMGEAVELIELNLKMVSNMKDLFKEVDESNKELKQKLTFKGFERKVNLLNYSITVCADPNCKKYEYIGETRKRVPT